MRPTEMGMDMRQGIEGQGKKYRIAWKSKETGATGQGEYLDEEVAKAWLEKGNMEHPELEHWLEAEDQSV